MGSVFRVNYSVVQLPGGWRMRKEEEPPTFTPSSIHSTLGSSWNKLLINGIYSSSPLTLGVLLNRSWDEEGSLALLILFLLVSGLYARKAPDGTGGGEVEEESGNSNCPMNQIFTLNCSIRENRTPPSVYIPIINKLTQQRRSSRRKRKGGGDHLPNNNFVRQQWQPPTPPSSSVDREQITLEGSADQWGVD